MILAHYTSPLHVDAIIGAGYLQPSESNVSMVAEGVGPDVVWLTSDLDAPLGEQSGMVHGTYALKRQVRFLVDVPEALAVKWTDWSWTAKMDPEWRSIMVAAGGGPEQADTWYVVPVPVRKRFWVSAEDRVTGQHLINPCLSLTQEERN